MNHLFRRIRAFVNQLNRVKRLAGGDEKCLAVFAAEADVGRPILRHVNVVNLFSGFVEDGHAAAGEIKIALLVNRHAVRAERTDESFVRQRAVGLDVVAPGFAGADVGDKEILSVRRAGDAVGLAQIIGYACERLAVRCKVINLFVGQRHGRVVPPTAPVERVGNEHAAIGRDPDVVRAVHVFALIIGDEHRHGFVGRDGPELVVFIRAGDEVAVRVEMHPVGVAGRLHERGEFSVRAPFHDAVVVLVNEKHVSVFIACRAFGELEIAREFLESRAGRNHAFGGR